MDDYEVPKVYIWKEGGRLCSASVLSPVQQPIFTKLWVVGCLVAMSNVIGHLLPI